MDYGIDIQGRITAAARLAPEPILTAGEMKSPSSLVYFIPTYQLEMFYFEEWIRNSRTTTICLGKIPIDVSLNDPKFHTLVLAENNSNTRVIAS